MTLTEDSILNWYSTDDFYKGREYFRQRRVRNYHAEESDTRVFITCTVRGLVDYSVTFYLTDAKLVDHCTCPRFARTSSCKHMVAALLEHISQDSWKQERERRRDAASDRRARGLLDAYLAGTKPKTAAPGIRVKLQPTLRSFGGSSQYPELGLRVGTNRMYVVRNIGEFLDRVEAGSTFSYGKNLTLCHELSEFDEPAQALISLLQDFRETHLDLLNNQFYHAPLSLKESIRLSGSTFDQFFDLYLGQSLPGETGRNIMLTEGNPGLTLSVSSQGQRTRLELDELEDLIYFGSAKNLYILQDDRLMRTNAEFRSHMRPLLDHGAACMSLSREDLVTFCSCVLPAIRNHISLEDSKGVLAEHCPDPCMPCFYLDLEDDTLLCRLTCRYGEQELAPIVPTPAGSTIKRDLPEEQNALQLVEQWFTKNTATGRYELEGEEEMIAFLTEQLDGLRAVGEVFVSDRLNNLEVRPSTASIGVSVSDGLLELELDTGGFPVEELEEVYRSMLRRRKYHRLKDGRFLMLDGSPIESMAEAAHMTQLTQKELKRGTITIPAYRSLYLDSVLSEGDGLLVSRDVKFRDMVRRFKTVSDSDYTVPEPFSGVLRPYQKTGFRWLKTLESCGFGGILADEMGLGKTLQMITFFSTVPYAVTGLPNLVVCPASLVLNWGDELARFAPDLKVKLILGSASQRNALLSDLTGTDVVVTSYDLLKRDIEQFQHQPFYCCVLDEAQYIKNQQTLASKAVKSINSKQRFVLTGTPIENRLSELWNLFDFLMPGYLFTHNRFVEQLERPIIKAQDERAQEMLKKLVRPFLLRRLKKDVLKELPPKLEYVRKVALSDPEKKLYYASVLAARDQLSGTTEKLQILAALTRLRQICCNPALCFENYTDDTSKLDACMELVHTMTENGHQILLFSQFTSMLGVIQQRLLAEGISCYLLQGSTTKERRAQLVRDFNAGMAQVFLISLKAGGTGLNLTAADVVIHYDPWWNIAAQNQATDRAHRIGQKACVQVYKLIAADTIEEKILLLQERKSQLMDTLETESDSILTMNREELLALLD